MVLKHVTIVEVIKGMKDRIPTGKHVWAIYGTITKPNADGSELDDITRIISDEYLTNFLAAANRVFRPIIVQVELIRAIGVQTPPPDK